MGQWGRGIIMQQPNEEEHWNGIRGGEWNEEKGKSFGNIYSSGKNQNESFAKTILVRIRMSPSSFTVYLITLMLIP